jgi:Prolipoprotein diacylglyceryl transferase
MSADLVQAAALSASFWLAFALARRAEASALRVAASLVLGAAAAHLGWAALHPGAVAQAPGALLDPTRGFCALFVPLGPLVAAPRRGAERVRFLAAVLGALPVALAVARLGCIAAGCCLGAPVDLPWSAPDRAGTPRHPAALYDAAGCAALQVALRGLRRELRAGSALAGLGALRFATEPFRVPPPLGEPALDPRWLAALWIGFGTASAARSRRLGALPVARAPGVP